MLRSILLSLLLLVPLHAAARLAEPAESWQSVTPQRDLAEIRRGGVLRVLINQSRNSSGEIKGQLIGVESQRLRAFEHFLNAGNTRRVSLKMIPLPKAELMAALRRGEGDLDRKSVV